jgi:cell division protein FtsI/penicillin-binding protein 2
MNGSVNRTTDWRVLTIIVLLAMFALAIGARLVQLQWIDRLAFSDRANRQRTFVESIAARPGDIVDRSGRLMATTISVRSLYAVPAHIVDIAQFARDVAPRLNLDADRLAERLTLNRTKQFLWIKRRLTEQQAIDIRALEMPAESWGFRREFLRRYPQGRLAAHILGLRGIDGEGRGGVEQKLDGVLRGRDGERVLVRDARGRVIDVKTEADRPAEHGRTVVLSLDAVIQLYTERELDRVMEEWRPSSACAIVIDPATCDVLAMASRPAFDPNNPVDVLPAAWKNTAIASMYEPGSTFKPFIVAWAVDREIISRDETFNCERGAYRMGRRILHDHHPYGQLSVTDILVKSSNIGMAKIGERMTNRSLYEAAVTFGFGRRTGTELPGELTGVVRKLSKWNRYSTGSIPMGQELAVTPLQLITAHAALANGGKLLSPRLVLGDMEAMDEFGRRSSPTASAQVVTQTVGAETAAWIVTGPMRGVVQRGTGKKAQLPGFEVFGKSGTAQKHDPATGGYSSNRFVCSFVCGAPADNPRALVLVLVDEPTVGTSHYGGTVAAPAASRILEKTLLHLRVPSDASQPRTANRR